jgi:hypothetical protein
MKNFAHHCAFKDITDYIAKSKKVIYTYYGKGNIDVWVVTPYNLYNKESRSLNKELGIAGINKIGNTNGYKKL